MYHPCSYLRRQLKTPKPLPAQELDPQHPHACYVHATAKYQQVRDMMGINMGYFNEGRALNLENVFHGRANLRIDATTRYTTDRTTTLHYTSLGGMVILSHSCWSFLCNWLGECVLLELRRRTNPPVSGGILRLNNRHGSFP
ncbi:capsule polysaccharide biosynthesis [Moniliophthora roreri]|nr:capsule polysaccharide biosynthesis [Moniliophthora roreri]